MAKRQKKTPAQPKKARAPAQGVAPKGSEAHSMKMPSKNKIKELVRDCENIKGKASELNGEIGGMISAAVEAHNLHKGAFATIRRLNKMDQAKLYAWLQHFDVYREHMELDKKAGQPLDLDAGGQTTESSDEDDEQDLRPRHLRPVEGGLQQIGGAARKAVGE